MCRYGFCVDEASACRDGVIVPASGLQERCLPFAEGAQAFVGNTGHCGNEIDLAGLEGLNCKRHVNIKPQKTFVFTTAYENDVHFLPKQLDEQVETLRLPALGAVLTVFGHEHADSVVDKVEGPYKFRCSCVHCRR